MQSESREARADAWTDCGTVIYSAAHFKENPCKLDVWFLNVQRKLQKLHLEWKK